MRKKPGTRWAHDDNKSSVFRLVPETSVRDWEIRQPSSYWAPSSTSINHPPDFVSFARKLIRNRTACRLASIIAGGDERKREKGKIIPPLPLLHVIRIQRGRFQSSFKLIIFQQVSGWTDGTGCKRRDEAGCRFSIFTITTFYDFIGPVNPSTFVDIWNHPRCIRARCFQVFLRKRFTETQKSLDIFHEDYTSLVCEHLFILIVINVGNTW